MRLILSLFVSLIVAWASQADAVAQSEMAGASDQVICGAQGPTHVTLDANGRALQGHPCGHCLAAHLADLPGPMSVAVAPVTRSAMVVLVFAAQIAVARATIPRARAPPVLAV